MLQLSQIHDLLLPLWVKDLDVELEDVLDDDHFLELGGDSIAAVRISKAAQKVGITVTVKDIFEYSCFGDLVKHVASTMAQGEAAPAEVAAAAAAFSLLPNIQSSIQSIAESLNVNVHSIQDAYPATPMQEALMVLSASSPSSYTRCFKYQLSQNVNLDQFRDSWSKVYAKSDILRTRILFLEDFGTIQVVLKAESAQWEDSQQVTNPSPMSYGSNLARFSIITPTSAGEPYVFCMALHHSIYDGWSQSKLLSQVFDLYNGAEATEGVAFSKFVQYTESSSRDSHSKFWTSYLENCTSSSYFAANFKPQSPASRKIMLDSFSPPSVGTTAKATASVMLRTAMAVLLSRREVVDQATFGITLSGRNADLDGITEISGPTVTTMPVRVDVSSSQTVKQCLEEAQRQATEMIPHEQFGMHRISHLSASCRTACAFDTLLIVQPDGANEARDRLLRPLVQDRETDFYTNTLVLECFLRASGEIHFEVQYDASVISSSTMERMMAQLKHIATQLWTAGPEMTMEDIDACSSLDCQLIENAAGSAPVAVERLIHEEFRRYADNYTHKRAVDAHDGSFTYEELDTISTNMVPHVLAATGSKTNVLLCFEKSKWMVVAMLAVLKAGCACVPLHPSHPQQRLREIATDVEASVVLTSSNLLKDCSTWAPSAIAIDDVHNKGHGNTQNTSLDMSITASDRAFIMYTSGSTGRPKGVIQTHSGMCTILESLADAMEYKDDSRVIQFAAYTFDVSIGDTFSTFFRGGCLCIPSETQRSNDLAGYMNQLQVTHACLTPTVAKTLARHDLPMLENLTLGGELLASEDAAAWVNRVKLNNIYGVTECTIWNSLTAVTAEHPGKIAGRLAARFWIVSPSNVNRLVPFGSVGELVIEGPTVSPGYWNDAAKTKDAFIQDPTWAATLQSVSNYSFYRTGDLARFEEDGSIYLIGRKDNQLKLRGQRLEPAEIERAIQKCLEPGQEVIVEVISPRTRNNDSSTKILAAFITIGSTADAESQQASFTSRIPSIIANDLPQHMVPSFYLPIEAIPRTTSGKSDRLQLRELGKSFSLEELRQRSATTQDDVAKDAEMTDNERLLRTAWATLFDMDPESIRSSDHFVRLGGNSIDAMKLSAAMGKQGLVLNVDEIFKNLTLSSMSQQLRRKRQQQLANIVPLSLLPCDQSSEATIEAAAQWLSIASENIEDVLPCTALQEGFAVLSEKNLDAFNSVFTFALPADANIPAFKGAWERVFANTPCLRTRIVFLPGVGSVQAVIKENILWEDAAAVRTRSAAQIPGLRMCRFSLSQPDSESWQFDLFIHHSLYDGWSLPLTFKDVYSVYSTDTLEQTAPFSSFIQYVKSMETESKSYWAAKLDGYSLAQFPPQMPESDQDPYPMKLLSSVGLPSSKASTLAHITSSTCIKAAWALLVSRWTEASDVVFGITSTGRTAPIEGIHGIRGPTLATVPFRVSGMNGDSLTALLEKIQADNLDAMRHEQLGINQIKALNSGAQDACLFKTLLLIQSESEMNAQFSTPVMTLQSNSLAGAGDLGYPLVMECKLASSSVQLVLQYDANAMEANVAELLLDQFSYILNQILTANHETRIQDIAMCTDRNLAQITKWNEAGLEYNTNSIICVHEAFMNVARYCPDSQAIVSWDGTLTYSELNDLSSKLSSALIERGAGPGQYIPLLFEKSQWAIVAILAICKSGAAFVPLDVSTPTQRLADTISQIEPKLILASSNCTKLASQFTDTFIEVSATAVAQLATEGPAISSVVTPKDLLFALFTSGTTGKPKGVLVEHGGYMTSAVSRKDVMGRSSSTRHLQFASYAFDAAIEDIVLTLLAAGCICIPTEEERMDPLLLSEAIARMQVTSVDVTPSFLERLTPSSCPSLQTITLGGECMTTGNLRKWADHVQIVNAYGPSECSATSHVATGITSKSNPANIGRGFGCMSWIVEPANHHRLAPIGVVGELLIEGSIVSRGYLNNQEKTEEAFIRGLRWADDANRLFYATGDLVRYEADGTVIFIGRKDTQVKIRSQRIELEEIEHHLVEELEVTTGVAVEVIKPLTDAGQPDETGSIAAFITHADGFDLSSTALEVNPLVQASISVLSGNLTKKLAAKLPRYMLPTFFIPVTIIPKTVSHKVDRKSLRQFGSRFSLRNLRSLSASSQTKTLPKTENETELRRLIAKVLNVSQDSVDMACSFTELSGDSIAAMKLSAECRAANMRLSVREIFQSADIIKMAAIVQRDAFDSAQNTTIIKPFSLLKDAADTPSLLEEVTKMLGVATASIQDMYPCTPLQEGMIALSSQNSGTYTGRLKFVLDSSVDIERFEQAWSKLVAAIPILRTRIVNSSAGLLQVVLSDAIAWETAPVSSLAFSNDSEVRLTDGAPLIRFAMSPAEGQPGSTLFTCVIHHSLYDGWSMPMMLDHVETLYDGGSLPESPSFAAFVKHVQEIDWQVSNDYWRQELEGFSTSVQFPPRHWTSQRNDSDSGYDVIRKALHLAPCKKFTPATILKAAWALTISSYTDEKDVVLGMTLSGRNAPLDGIENIVGPTFTTVPVRINLNAEASVSDLLLQVQSQAFEMMPHELAGLQNIQSLSASAATACGFENLFMIQTPSNKSSKLMHQSSEKSTQVADLGYAIVLDCAVAVGHVEALCEYDTGRVHPAMMDRVLGQFNYMIEQLQKHDDLLIGQIVRLNPSDEMQLSTWNVPLSAAIDLPYTTLLREQMSKSPNAPAVAAWDGRATYKELDDDSNKLAAHLKATGARLGSNVLIPVIFRKTYWFTVTVLAIVKLGSAFVPLDPTTPRERLREIFRQTSAELVLVSQGDASWVDGLADRIMEISKDSIQHEEANDEYSIFQNAPTDLLYAIYTSGSTGKPKGVLTDHRAFNSCAVEKAPRFHRDATSRVLQFASHSFDTTVEDILTTLLVGGCICVPSDEDRFGNLAGFITKEAANTADLTPSTMSLFQPEDVPTLKTLLLGGEPLNASAIEKWSHLDLLNVYGPTEASIVCILRDNVKIGDNPADIGTPVACNTWIVDENDHNKLRPVGAIGEMLLEGHILAQGYLDNAAATDKAFIESPTWAPCRRFYRTGDLVYYTPTGNLICLGRRDSQIKLRGQRIELSGIEASLARFMPNMDIAVDVIQPSNTAQDGDNRMLVAFFTAKDNAKNAESLETSILPLTENVATYDEATLASKKLREVLPGYMIPVVYIAMSQFPLTVSSKLDRKTLRSVCNGLSTTDMYAIGGSQSVKTEPNTSEETLLRDTWCQLLNLESQQVGVEDNFFATGGNSITAIRLASSLRAQGYQLMVPSIFRYPVLSDMAAALVPVAPASEAVTKEPFSLLEEKERAVVISTLTGKFGLGETDVQDAYRCTPLQEGLLALTAQQKTAYVTNFSYWLPADVDLARFKTAWETVVAANPILRTFTAYIDNVGSIQAVLNQPVSWADVETLAEFRDTGLTLKSGSKSKALMVCALIPSTDATKQHRHIFSLTLHHSLYDGWSMEQLLSQLQNAYHGSSQLSIPPYSDFIAYLQDSFDEDTQTFWKQQLSGVEPVSFPSKPSAAPKPSSTMEHSVLLPKSAHSTTRSMILRGAWAIIMSRYLQTEDVVFGATLSGRDAAVEGLSEITGPVATTVPIRVTVNNASTVEQYLTSLQQQSVDMIRHQHAGLQNIKKLSSECESACDFQTLLIVQPGDDGSAPWLEAVKQTSSQSYYTYPLVLECTLQSDHIAVEAVFDDVAISTQTMKLVLEQFGFLIGQLNGVSEGNIGHLDMVSPYEMDILKAWNQEKPETISKCVHHLIQETASQTPSSPAVCGWDASFTYEELMTTSQQLALKLQSLGVGPEDMVPHCFEKSSWAIVATMATIQAGGAFVPLDSGHPVSRLKDIISQVEAKVLLVSKKMKEKLSEQSLDVPMLEVSEDFMQDKSVEATELRQTVTPDNALYLVFTSGSTGRPKGVCNTHVGYSSAALPRAEPMKRDNKSRVLQFASYSFDMSVDDILLTLITGGCICVVSDQDRSGDIGNVIQQMNINAAHLTPSYVDALDPKSLESLDVLCLLGEAMTTSNVKSYADRVTLINTYGPSEAAVVTTVTPVIKQNDDPSNIGFALGSRVWVVDGQNHNMLAPIGVPGELLIEGPILARGYLNNKEKTDAAFIYNPEWTSTVPEVNPDAKFYKTGDLVYYHQDGSVKFLGRKDTQVKLRGHRIELQEIEYHLNSILPSQCEVAVEIVTLKTSKANSILAAFIAHIPEDHGKQIPYQDSDVLLSASQGIISLAAEAQQKLRAVVPSYMLPNIYIPVTELPITTSNKRDRKVLKQLALEVDIADYELGESAQKGARELPANKMEETLMEIYASVLSVSYDEISTMDSFISLGGDSLDAIRVTVKAADMGFQLNSSDIFRSPSLKQLALQVKSLEAVAQQEDQEALKFSLIGAAHEQRVALRAIQDMSQHSSDKITAIYPCTLTQEGLIMATIRNSQAYSGVFTYQLSDSVDLDRLRLAWEDAYNTVDVLRTRIYHDDDLGCFQAVVDEPVIWEKFGTVQQFTDALTFQLGERLCRFAIVEEGASTFFVWAMHHAVYDAITLNIILQMVKDTYFGKEVSPPTPFIEFVQHLSRANQEESQMFWTKYLSGCPAQTFPKQTQKNIESSRGTFRRSFDIPQAFNSIKVPLSTVLRSAWALVIGQLESSADVVFGMTLNGRSALPSHLLRVAGPAITTVPVRVVIDLAKGADVFLHNVQSQAAAMMPYEHAGIRTIRSFSDDANRACQFGSILVLQSNVYESLREDSSLIDTDGQLMSEVPDDTFEPFHDHPIVITCFLYADTVMVEVEYNDATIDLEQAQNLADQFEINVNQLCGNPSPESPGSPEILYAGGQPLLSDASSNSDYESPNSSKGGSSGKATPKSMELDTADSSSGFVTAVVEGKMRSIWSKVLNREEDGIEMTHNFFKLGGDSISTLRFVRLAHEEGIPLNVMDIYKNPVLSDLCVRAEKKLASASLSSSDTQALASNVPWQQANPALAEHIQSRLNITADGIEDVAPATDFQQIAVASGMLQTRGYSNYVQVDFPETLGFRRVSSALGRLLHAHAILRAVFVPFQGSLHQVVVKSKVIDLADVACAAGSTMDDTASRWMALDTAKPSVLSLPLLRGAVLRSTEGKGSRVILQLSHALYDATYIANAVNDLTAALSGSPIDKTPSFLKFANDVFHQKKNNAALDYWKTLLHGSQITNVIPKSGPTHCNILNSTVSRTIPFAQVQKDGTSFAIVLQTAWAVVLSQLVDSNDVVFWHLVSGRNMSLNAVAGPCINLVPVRAQMGERNASASELLRQLKDQYVATLPYETTGFQAIIEQCTSWPKWTRFSSIVQHQNLENTEADEQQAIKLIPTDHDAADIWIVSMPDKTNTTIHFSYCKDTLPECYAEQISDALVRVIQHLSSQPDDTISAVAAQGIDAASLQPWLHKRSKLEKNLVSNSKTSQDVTVDIPDIVNSAWSQAFGSTTIDNKTPFFEVSGNPIIGAELQWFYQTQGCDISLEDIFEHPSKFDQARFITGAGR